jgi:hypothetical protein
LDREKFHQSLFFWIHFFLQSNMAEMRGLLLDLDKGKALLYNFYGEGESRHYIDALKWGNWDEFSQVESPKKEAANIDE